MKSVDNVLEELLRRMEQAEQVIEEWKVTFADDPCYALEWSEGVFIAAARRRVLGEIAEALGAPQLEPVVVDGITDHCLRTVIRRARNPQQSTSTASNLMDRRMTQAWGEMLELLDPTGAA